MELELKLHMSPENLQTLKESAWLKEIQAGPTRTRRLRAIYYDTTACDVKAAGYTLRVRKEGRQYIQCLKSRCSGHAVMAREEVETPVPSTQPDLQSLRGSGLEDAIGADALIGLKPVFETDIRRTIKQVRHEGHLIELAFDQGTITADDHAVPVCEAELELVNGELPSLIELAQRIVKQVPCRLEHRGKADAGYQLIGRDDITWQRAEKVELNPESTTEETLIQLAAQTLSHLQANEGCVREGSHPEGVHQMRVAVRRLRSLLALYKEVLPEEQRHSLNEELRWLGQSLSKARDWDVFLDETLAPVCRSMPDEPELEQLRRLAGQQRENAYATAREALDCPRYTHLQLQFAAWLTDRQWRQQPLTVQAACLFDPVLDFATALLKKRRRTLRKRGRNFRQLEPANRHELRLTAKKLRYAMEFFAPLYGASATKTYIKTISKLQDDLGRYNDLVVARQLLDDLSQEAKRGKQPAITFASGLIMGWHHHRLDGLRKKQEKRWKRFRKATPFWQ